jgi:hypothetical protein
LFKEERVHKGTNANFLTHRSIIRSKVSLIQNLFFCFLFDNNSYNQYQLFTERLGKPREETKHVTFVFYDEDNQKQTVTYSLNELPLSMHPPPEEGYNSDEYPTEWGW